MQKLDLVWAMFKKYLNFPNQIIKQDDVLADLFMNGKEDLREFMNVLGIRKYTTDITFGKLLTLIKVM